MRSLVAALLVANTASSRDDNFITRCGSQLCDGANRTVRFAGANIYWLGLDENPVVAYATHSRIYDALYTAKVVMGAGVVRSHTLGISTGNPLSFEPALNVFNDTALDAADYAIYVAGQLGLRLQIPLTDNYHYFHGGKYNFCQWLGVPESAFYTNASVIAAFKTYISRRLLHVNPYTGKTSVEDPTIMAWETGNELLPPANWTADIAAFIKSVDPNHLVVDGRYGVDIAALGTATAVDIFSDHFYPVDAGRLEADAALVSAAGKVLVAGEFGWTSGDVTGFMSTVESLPVVAYSAYWSLFPHNDSWGFEQHNDGFTLHWPGDNAGMASFAAAARLHAYAMAGVSPVPPNAVPLSPTVTLVHLLTPTTVAFAWRGGAGGANYSILASSGGGNGPFDTTLCKLCATDNTTPLTVTLPAAGAWWLLVVPYNVDGVAGPPSPVVQVSSGGTGQRVGVLRASAAVAGDNRQ